MTKTIHIGKFVRRQTPQSEFSHWTLTDEQLLERIQKNFAKATKGYREGVLLVPVEPDGFFSSTVLLKSGDKIVGEYKPRREGEEPRKSSYSLDGEKTPAKSVYIVLYAREVLEEDRPTESDADYEIVSVNASPTEDEAPIPTGALIANHFQLSGGTATNMSDAEFVTMLRKSILYWKDKAQACPEEFKVNLVNESIDNLNGFCKETVKRIYEELEKLGAKVRDEHGLMIPQPQNNVQDQIMFLAGQLHFALFVQGATSNG